MRHLRRQARPSPVPRQAAPEGGSVPPSGTRTPSSARPARPCQPRAAWNPARPRGGPGGAAPPQARPPPGRASREAANMAPSVTQPPRPPSPPATRTSAPSGRGPGGRAAQSLLFPPAVLPVAMGARGRQRVNARALAPPSAPSARLPCPPSELRAAPSPRRGRSPVARRWPPLLASHRGARAPEGGLLTAAGVRFLSSRWILLFMSMFPSSPLSKLNFPRRGRRGERRPGLRGESRRKEAAGGGGGVVPGGVRACGRAEPPEPSYSRERRETMEGKGGWSAALASLPPPPAKAPHCA